VPRAGLNSQDVTVAAAGLADEMGIGGVTMGLLAGRLGVRPPSLYKHVDSLADVQHRVASLAMAELSELTRDAVQGRAGTDALAAFMTAVRGYVLSHPGRYMATTGVEARGPDDPLLVASDRVIGSLAAVLRGYGIAAGEMDHALRTVRSTIHGFAVLEASRGFQWAADTDESFRWLIAFVDRGLRASQAGQPGQGQPGQGQPGER
jgi:AcrR family transcriptional regulator